MNKTKISIRLFIITMLLLLLTQFPVFAAKGKSTSSCVRIRQSASTESEVLEVLAAGDDVEILGDEGDWYKVSAKGFTGYVSKEFISKSNDGAEPTNDTENTKVPEETKAPEAQNTPEPANISETRNDAKNTEKVEYKVYKMSEDTVVNILPLITSECIGELKKDADVTVRINAGLWVYVESNGVSGWIRIDKLSTENVGVETINNENETTNNEENNQNNVQGNSGENNQENNQESNQESNQQNNQEPAKPVEPAETSQAAPQTNMYASPKTMYVKSEAVNVRSQSNTTSEVVDALAINAEVKVVGDENGWYKIEANGRSGYIRADLLSEQKTEVTSRSNNVERNVASSEAVPVSSSGVTGNDIAEYAKQFVGCSYVYGASGPSSFDCSGLTMYVYKHFGYSLSHSSRVQATQGRAVTGDLQPGDILVFSNDGKTVGHVGIYIGNDKFVHASDSTTGVIIGNLSDRWNKSKYWGARRIL